MRSCRCAVVLIIYGTNLKCFCSVPSANAILLRKWDSNNNAANLQQSITLNTFQQTFSLWLINLFQTHSVIKIAKTNHNDGGKKFAYKLKMISELFSSHFAL